MLLSFAIGVVLATPLLVIRRKLLRRQWLALFMVGFLIAFLVSYVSVSTAWNPYESVYFGAHFGNYSGMSALSYPVWINVYMTPFNEQVNVTPPTGIRAPYLGGNVTFSMFFTSLKVLVTNGSFNYNAGVFGVELNYKIDFPFFSSAIGYFDFLIFLFTVSNTVGLIVGFLLTYYVAKRLRHTQQPSERNLPSAQTPS